MNKFNSSLDNENSTNVLTLEEHRNNVRNTFLSECIGTPTVTDFSRDAQAGLEMFDHLVECGTAIYVSKESSRHKFVSGQLKYVHPNQGTSIELAGSSVPQVIAKLAEAYYEREKEVSHTHISSLNITFFIHGSAAMANIVWPDIDEEILHNAIKTCIQQNNACGVLHNSPLLGDRLWVRATNTATREFNVGINLPNSYRLDTEKEFIDRLVYVIKRAILDYVYVVTSAENFMPEEDMCLVFTSTSVTILDSGYKLLYKDTFTAPTMNIANSGYKLLNKAIIYNLENEE